MTSPAGICLEVEAAWRWLLPPVDTAVVVADWVAELPELSPFEPQLAELVKQAVASAIDSGAVAVLPFAAPYAGRLYHGIMLVLRAVGADNDLARLVADVEAENGDLRVPNFYEVDEVVLDHGLPALRVRQLVDVPGENETEALVMDTVRYAVPVPGSTEMVVLSFATQALELSDALIGRADRLAAGFRFGRMDSM